jgi:prevent-host-death family protein
MEHEGDSLEQVGIRELKEQASSILRRVREAGATYEVTYHGHVVARLVPVTSAEPEPSLAAFWADWDDLATEVSADWPPEVSAVQAVRDGRRDL